MLKTCKGDVLDKTSEGEHFYGFKNLQYFSAVAPNLSESWYFPFQIPFLCNVELSHFVLLHVYVALHPMAL